MFYQLVILCCFLVIWWLWPKIRKYFKHTTRFSSISLVTDSFKMLNSVQMFKWARKISERCLRKSDLIALRFGPFKTYAVADPDDCLTIMNTCLKRHYHFDFAKSFLGNGLITADVPTWKRNRKLLNPAFNQQILDDYVEIFNFQAQRLVDAFATEVGKPFDQEILLRINNLETVCSTSLGIDASEHSELLREYMPQLPKLMKSIKNRMQKFWLHSDFIYNMTSAKKHHDEEAKRFMTLSKLVIQKRKLKNKNQEYTDHKGGNVKTFLDFVMDLANSTGCFTDEQIREETDTIVAAGHDTSAILLTFVLKMLGSHADVQDKAYEEILHVLGDSDKTIDKDDLSNLVYIEAILKETLRLYPILPVLPRRVEQDVKLKNSTIKANSDCFVLVYGLHRHSIWGPDADQFRPERWLDKETLPDPKYFAGFGMGRRACIGRAYSMMSMKTTLAYVLRTYRVSSDASKMVLKLHAIARPASGHYISLAFRNT